MHLSEEWYRIYGFDPAEGPPVWEKRLEHVRPEDRLKWKTTIERAIMEKADYDLELRILLPNGMVKWIHTVGHPVLSEAGDLEQCLGLDQNDVAVTAPSRGNYTTLLVVTKKHCIW